MAFARGQISPSTPPARPLPWNSASSTRQSQRLDLQFKDTQRYDFILEDAAGNKVWQWSHGKMFAQVIAQETLASGREELVYTATCEGLTAGRYSLTGMLLASDQTLSATISIVVK